MGRIAHMKTLFFGDNPKHDVCGTKYSDKELPENFSGKFVEIRVKILHTAKDLPAPTPMLR